MAPADFRDPPAPSTPPVDMQFFDRLRQMNERFAAGVPATLARLRGLGDGFDPAVPDGARARELQQMLHTIAGSAATFGFRTFGVEARNLEQRLRVLLAFEQVGEAEWTSWLLSLDHYLDWAAIDARAEVFPVEGEPGDV